MATPSQIIARARELLKERGWVQGTLRSKNGYCTIGALHAASKELKGGHNRRKALEIVAQVAARRRGHRYFSSETDIWRYNDESGRKKAEVLSLLRTAERRAQKQEAA